MKKPSSSSSSTSTTSLIQTTPCCTAKVGLKRGPWTPEEDDLLANYIKREGEGRWRMLPKKAGLLRCGKSCRLRWMNYLRPCVKRGHITPDEEDLILRLHRLLGNRWSLIAGRIPGRTDNEIKNYWNTHLSKKLISQGIDPRTHKPLLKPNSSIANNNNKPSSPKENHIDYVSLEGTVDVGMNGTDIVPYQSNYETVVADGDVVNMGTIGGSRMFDDGYFSNNDDVFSSFLNSLINEDVYNNQPQLQANANMVGSNSSDSFTVGHWDA